MLLAPPPHAMAEHLGYGDEDYAANVDPITGRPITIPSCNLQVFEVLSRAEQPTKEPLMWLLWQTAAADKKHREAILAQPNAIAKVIDVLKEEPEPGNDKVLWKAKRCACGLLGLLAYQNKQAQEVLAAKDSLVPLMEIVNYRFGNPRPIRKEAPPKPPPEPTPPPEAAPANAGKGGKGKDKKGKAVEEPPKEEEEEVKEEVEEVMVTDDEAARCDWVRCVEESCGALKNLLYENRALQEEMLGRDGLDVLMRAMRMEDEGVAASACNLMRIMCRSPTLQRQFLSDPNILQVTPH